MRSMFVVAVAFLCVACVVQVAGAASPPKATGGIQFYRVEDDSTQIQSWVEFEAHQINADGAGKGQLRYHDEIGNKLAAKITCVAVWDDYATFSGEVVSTNIPDWEGKWLVVWVHDADSPGSNGDEFGADLYDADTGCAAGTVPREWSPVIAGNLVVHP
ncbi:MAG: hypothetical protein WAW06_08795 [bacterium]